MDEAIREKNDLTIKLRCKDLLETKEGEKSPEWKKVYSELYQTSYQVKLDNGRSYPTIADLFRFFNGKSIQYALIFSDMPQELHNQHYKPLRQLGKSVFVKKI